MANEHSSQVNLSPITNALDEAITLDGTAHGHVRLTSSSGTFETVFQQDGSGFIFGQLVTATLSGATAEMRIFDNAVQDAQKIGHGKAGANQSVCVDSCPAHYKDGVIVQLKSDGTNEVEGLISTIGANPSGQQTIVSSKASFLNFGAPNDNFGTSNLCQLRNQTANLHRAVVEFDLSSIPIGAVIESAIFQWTIVAGGGASSPTDIYAILKPWDELQVTWNDRLTGTPWSSGGLGSGTDREATASASPQPTGGAPQDVETDITTLVQRWIDGSLANNGFIMQIRDFDGSSKNDFSSDDASQDKPTLVITFTN